MKRLAIFLTMELLCAGAMVLLLIFFMQPNTRLSLLVLVGVIPMVYFHRLVFLEDEALQSQKDE